MNHPAGKRDPLLAAICHDLRAPLASVTMGASFVLQSTPDDEANVRARKVLAAMLRSCSQMDRLIRNLADLSEIESDAVDLRIAEHDAREILTLVAEASRAAAEARSVTITIDAPEHESLRCDRDRVLHALGHLVSNAVLHAPEGSEIRLSVAAVGDQLAFRVSDRGPGPSEEALAHLFEVHGKARGLAIARGFTEAHGGSIALEPRQGGTTAFTISLPRNPAPPATSA